jgi:hypothetical protein
MGYGGRDEDGPYGDLLSELACKKMTRTPFLLFSMLLFYCITQRRNCGE